MNPVKSEIVRTDESASTALYRAINEAQVQILTQRTPNHVKKQRPGKGGKQFTYVEHAWVTEQLNLAFGWAWNWEIVEWRVLPNEADPAEVMVLGRLTVQTQLGTVTKMQFGQKDVLRDKQSRPLSIADDLKAASSDGLKKAASLLGLALDLYSDDISRYQEPEPAWADQETLLAILETYRAMYPDNKTRDDTILAHLFARACQGDTTLSAANAAVVLEKLEQAAMNGRAQ